jgi:hypothetical protein
MAPLEDIDPFVLTPELETELLEGITQADRGETVDWETVRLDLDARLAKR